MTNPIVRLFRRAPAFSRSAVRHPCLIDARLSLTDSDVFFDGRVINLSLGGAMFRPPLAHLMNRWGVPISLKVGDMAITGELMATTPHGFGLRFDHPLGDPQLHRLLELSRMEAEQAA